MTLNNFLCRWFKSKNDDYVTIGSMFEYSLYYSIIIGISVLVIYSVIITILAYPNIDEKAMDNNPAILLGSVIIMMGIAALIAIGWCYVSETKIAHCDREKKKEG